MAEQEFLLKALRDFARTMSGGYEISEMSFQLAEGVTEAMGATGAGVSVATDKGDLKFVTATSQLMVEMEQAQEAAQQGPCVSAYQTQQPVVIPDIRLVEDWPAYTAAADRLSLRAVIGFPLKYKDTRLGALNLYNAEPRDWTDSDLDTIDVFANMATAYLVRNSELAEAKQLAGQLQTALDSRVVIEQAKGLLAGERGISLDQAFEMLRDHSRRNNIKMSEVCDAVVNLGLRIGEPNS